MEKLKPIILTDEDTHERYVLEFDRESVKFAENNGFRVDDFQPVTGPLLLFYFAFRKNHPKMTQRQTEKILFDKLGGFPDGMVERLVALYRDPIEGMFVGEDEPKNARMTVEM